MTDDKTRPHIGRKIERIRMLRGMKQETLATALGLTQSAVSRIEQSENVDDDKLKSIADALEVSVDAIKNFTEEAAINIISSTLNDNAGSVNHYPIFNFNAIEKVVELYEKLLAEKDEMIKVLKQQQKG